MGGNTPRGFESHPLRQNQFVMKPAKCGLHAVLDWGIRRDGFAQPRQQQEIVGACRLVQHLMLVHTYSYP